MITSTNYHFYSYSHVSHAQKAAVENEQTPETETAKNAVQETLASSQGAAGYRAQATYPARSDSFQALLQTQEVSAGSTGRSTGATWQDIASKYDVTNLSGTERIALGEALEENNLISNNAMMMLIAPSRMNPDMDAREDYFTDFKESFEAEKKLGLDPDQRALRNELLGILERLNGLSATA